MVSLFPDEVLSLNISCDNDIRLAVTSFNGKYSEEFIALAAQSAEIRQLYDLSYHYAHDYLDNDFVGRFRGRECINMDWELHLATVFLSHGLRLLKKTSKEGPDFCIIGSNRRIWVEATVCEGQSVPMALVKTYPDGNKMYSAGGNTETLSRGFALKITNSLAAKMEIFKRYRKNHLVKADDCCIVAISGCRFLHVLSARTLFKRALYGKGCDVYTKSQLRAHRMSEPFYMTEPIITKPTTGATVDAKFMCMDEFKGISAVIYAESRLANNDSSHDTGQDFIVGHHTSPIIAVPRSEFAFGTEVQADEDGNIYSIKWQ